METVERSAVVRGKEGQRYFKAVKILCMIFMDIVIVLLPKSIDYTTPKMNPKTITQHQK